MIILNNDKGVTLIELILAIAVAGIIMAAASNMQIFMQEAFYREGDRGHLHNNLMLIEQSFRKKLRRAENIEHTKNNCNNSSYFKLSGQNDEGMRRMLFVEDEETGISDYIIDPGENGSENVIKKIMINEINQEQDKDENILDVTIYYRYEEDSDKSREFKVHLLNDKVDFKDKILAPDKKLCFETP